MHRIIISLTLFLTSPASAEIVYMNCKFNEGWQQKGKDYENVKKSEDVALVRDKAKKVIKSANRTYVNSGNNKIITDIKFFNI